MDEIATRTFKPNNISPFQDFVLIREEFYMFRIIYMKECFIRKLGKHVTAFWLREIYSFVLFLVCLLLLGTCVDVCVYVCVCGHTCIKSIS